MVALIRNIKSHTILGKISLPDRFRDAVSFVLLAVLFGGAFVAIETGLRELPPLLFASLRFDIAAVALLSYILLRYPRSAWLPRTRNDVLGIGIAGLFLITLNNALLFVGQGHTTPTMASIMYGLNPILAPAFAWWLLGDRLSLLGLVGIGVALAGVVVIVQPSPATLTDPGTVGQVLILCAAAAVAIGSVLLKRFQPQMGSLPLTGWAMLVGALPLHAASLAAGESLTDAADIAPLTAVSLLIVGIPSTAVAYAVHFGLLERIGPVRTNLVAYLVPVVAALMGWVFLGAGLSAITVLGFLIVVVGFGLIERRTLQREVRRIRHRQRWRREQDQNPGGGSSYPCDD